MIKEKIKYSFYSYDKNIKLTTDTTKNMYLIHRALTQQLHNKRQGNAHTKTRSEIQGGGRKPWKQKGTGKARAGSIRSPLWKGGGTIFGPRHKKYFIKLNKKEKQLALKYLLQNKLSNTIVVKNFLEDIEYPNTKFALKHIQSLGIDTNINTKILIVMNTTNNNLYLSIRNIKNIEIIKADQLNTIALLKAEKLIITTHAIDRMNEVYNG
uniref:Large ribosomal subunit protein uL4c n=1 Tax=Betaphycus gelatinus TaxID=1191690 RepID=A0A8E7PH46_9FLOR|nr:50S ribosomal protein L4 [Betaphycus gelatinus]